MSSQVVSQAITETILRPLSTPGSSIGNNTTIQQVEPVESTTEIAVGGILLPQNSEEFNENSSSLLQQAVTELNQNVQNLQRKLQFSIDHDSGQTIIKVMDSETDQLIRQIPPERLLELSKALEKTRGLLFDTEA